MNSLSPGPVPIVQLPTGVPGLDSVLGGGIPEYSFNVIAGGPGTGKSTLASQIVFSSSSAARPAVYFSLLGEPPLKRLRYQQQFRFFAADKVNRSVHFVSLPAAQLEQDAPGTFDTIMQEVRDRNPSVVVLDALIESPHIDLHLLVRQLAINLSSWQATSFLITDHRTLNRPASLLLGIADGVLCMTRSSDAETSPRALQVLKMRGRSTLPVLHAMRITDDGVQVFPRTQTAARASGPRAISTPRMQFGLPALDELLGGGIPPGQNVLVAGPSGGGKSLLATHFVLEGARKSDPGVIALFDESPDTFISRAAGLGLELQQAIQAEFVALLDLRSLDGAVEERLNEIQLAARTVGARRVAIDSLAGLQLAVNADARASLAEIVFRLLTPLSDAGLTVLAASDRQSADALSFLADNIVELRHDQTRRSVAVAKMRTSRHGSDARTYAIGCGGVSLQVTASAVDRHL